MAGTPAAVRKGLLALVAATIITVAYIWSYTAAWDAAARMSPLLWAMFIGTNGLFVLFLLLTWRRHNWARWATIVWTALGILALVWSLVYAGASTVDRVVQLFIIAIEVWACYQLLSKSATSWFKRIASA
jgi:hypothetical protein